MAEKSIKQSDEKNDEQVCALAREALDLCAAARDQQTLVRLSRVSGGLIGVVPRDVIPVYCESMFPKSYGIILDFMHVRDEDIAAFGDKIEWLPEDEAKLA